jgi:TolB-like protein/Tfp pilus assembly protein PilF
LSFFNELKRRNVFRVGAAYVVVGWLIIQVVETIFPAFGFSDALIRIVTIVLAIGLVPVVILAWAFELTPEGLKREREVDRNQSITHHTGKKLDRLIMVVLALALGYFAFDKFVLDPQRQEVIREQIAEQVETARQEGRSEALVESFGEKSIAVLPFVNMSSDEEQEYFSDGISEELLNVLAKIPELRVISRSSAFSFKGKDINIPEIANRLNVAHILEGSVRKAGNRVRITAQLIDARADTHLWSQTYERQLDDIFAIQDEIASQVVDQLKVTLLGEAPGMKKTDPKAYALYLQARHLGRSGSDEGWEQAIELYRQALAIDPAYAPPWDGLANLYINQASKGLRSFEEAFSLAREAAGQALALDENYAPAHARLGWIARSYDQDLAAAAGHFERAVALDPTNTDILGNAAVLLSSVGRLDDAVALGEYANARDPVNTIGHANLGLIYFFAGRWDEAISSNQTALQLSPGYFGAHNIIGTSLLYKGELEAGLAAMEREGLEVFRLIGLAIAYHSLDREEDSNAVLAELIAKHERDWAYNIAYVLAWRNQTDEAFTWLDKAAEYGDSGLSQIVVQPEFESIREDPRWEAFLERLGNSRAELDAIQFDVTLPGQ